MSIIETDRTSILTHQSCPRKGYYSRHFNGTGIQRKSKGLALQFGSAFHEGAENLLRGDVEGAVTRAINYLNLAFSNQAVDFGADDKQSTYGMEEQKAIVEGLIRGWWEYNGERFLRDFEVIEVEQEGRAILQHGAKYTKIDSVSATEEQKAEGIDAVDYYHVSGSGEDVVLMFRPDALVREKLTGDLYVVSWKTASTFGQYTLNSIATDMQSMSEVWGVQNTHSPNQEHGYTMEGDIIPPPYQHIEGVLYLFCVKGQRKMDDYLGFKTQNTPLAYGWMKLGNTPEETEWSWQYSWLTEEINSKTGKPVKTTLGKGWKRVPVWESYPGGVKGWISALAAQEITPRHINPFESIFPESLPVSRRVDEIESWKRQVVGQELRIKMASEAISSISESSDPMLQQAVGDLLDVHFPQHTHNCYSYMSKCPFWECCFTPAVKEDPMSSGLYEIRVSNHPERGGEDD